MTHSNGSDAKEAFQTWFKAYSENYAEKAPGLMGSDFIAEQAWQAALNYAEQALEATAPGRDWPSGDEFSNWAHETFGNGKLASAARMTHRWLSQYRKPVVSDDNLHATLPSEEEWMAELEKELESYQLGEVVMPKDLWMAAYRRMRRK